MIEVPRCLSRLSSERLKNMNPFIRLCGLKCRHGEAIWYAVQENRNKIGMRVSCRTLPHSQGGSAAPCRYRTVRHGLLPTCGKQGQRVRWAADPIRLSFDRQTGEGLQRMPRGHGPNALPTGGASVVVRGEESSLHGEGKQFMHACIAYYSTQ